MFYWSGESEIDFIVREGNTITQIWQVVAGKLDDSEVLKGKLRTIEEAKQMFPEARAFIAVKTLPKKIASLPCKIIPLWLLLLKT